LQQAEDILGCVYLHGFRNLVIFNSHGGNLGVGQVLLERFGFRHPDCQLALVTWWKLVAGELLSLNESGPGGVGHACEFETSLMLDVAPHLVQMNQVVEPQNVPGFPWAAGDMLRGSRAGLYRTMRHMTPNGVYGDPRGASAEKGRTITGVVTAQLVQILADMRKGM
jgi:creatinine amidohydrolase